MRESEFDIEDKDKCIQEEECRDGGNEEVLVDVTDPLSYQLFVAVKRMRRLHWIGYCMQLKRELKWRNQRSQGGGSWNRH